MNTVQRLIVSLTTVLAVVFGTNAVTAPPASASDGYGTNYSLQCGVSIPWGYYCQIIWPKSASETMKQKLVAGATVAAVATWACGKIPNWTSQAYCVAWMAYNTYDTREAINQAHASGNKCVAVRWYSSTLGNSGGKHASAVTCNYGIQCCESGSGGGGGGGGGGSWRHQHRYALAR